MALKITLKPKERVIIGGAVVTNGNGRTELVVENDVPILRDKDIMKDHEADTPCRRIYFVVQLMYIDEKNIIEHHGTYWKLVQDILRAAPSRLNLIDQISDSILNSRYYKALKLARKLIDYEQEVTNNVRNSGRNSI
ncbi:MAG TPA: flagellar biosynthesis repressor FlbT [Thermodesulfovibrionales bacterium]|nr:flagellar biosynthesis repressor FlbT [Thermodesulfovibrionales bacterium]